MHYENTATGGIHAEATLPPGKTDSGCGFPGRWNCAACRAGENRRCRADWRPLPLADRGPACYPTAWLGIAAVGVPPEVRGVVCRLLGDDLKDLHNCGSFDTSEEALSALAGVCVGIVLVELDLPDMCGVKCARELVARAPGLKVILLADRPELAKLKCAISAGVSEFLISPFSPGQLLAAVRATALRSGLPGLPLLPAPEDPNDALDLRQSQFTACRARGISYKDIATRMGSSEALARKIGHDALLKLRAHNARANTMPAQKLPESAAGASSTSLCLPAPLGGGVAPARAESPSIRRRHTADCSVTFSTTA